MEFGMRLIYSMDWIKGSVLNSKNVTKYNKYLKKARGYKDWNTDYNNKEKKSVYNKVDEMENTLAMSLFFYFFFSFFYFLFCFDNLCMFNFLWFWMEPLWKSYAFLFNCVQYKTCQPDYLWGSYDYLLGGPIFLVFISHVLTG